MNRANLLLPGDERDPNGSGPGFHPGATGQLLRLQRRPRHTPTACKHRLTAQATYRDYVRQTADSPKVRTHPNWPLSHAASS